MELDSETPKIPKIRPVDLTKDEKQISKHAPNQFFRSLLGLRLSCDATALRVALQIDQLAAAGHVWTLDEMLGLR